MDHTLEQADARGNRRQTRVIHERGSEQPQGIRKSQPARQPVSEDNSTLGIEILSSSSKAMSLEGEKVCAWSFLIFFF